MEYGLIGEKLSHSYSIDIHKRIGDYEYTLNEIPNENLESFIKAKKFKGINVTIPYKQTVIPYLDEVDAKAKEIGAVNTIVNIDGKLHGYNTDYYGMLYLIKKYNIDFCKHTVMILGTGGTSKTAEVVAKDLKAKRIIKVSRNPKENAINYDSAYAIANDIDIIINTTPCGMFPNINECPIDIERFNNLIAVIDTIYNPINTELVVKAKLKNICAVGGLHMLVAQAIKAHDIFFDLKTDETTIIDIYNSFITTKQNIVLIGMPTSGKTTIGKMLKKKFPYTFVDTDEIIQDKYSNNIESIFKTQGENFFRQYETGVISDLAPKTSLIIATGGGAVLNIENIINLKKNGIIFFINRDLNKLTCSSDRPLLTSKDQLEKIYNERLKLYIKYADVIIENNETLDHAVLQIERKYHN